ncbi:hypothetical protein KJ762_06270 [bacterium]|nr:hypothetical protein [bacterium]MBU1063520.1 hypothetical protein [bacterium]MBU1634100.1 hypothetical protein [bacterium]MBU1872535.1 hypothetical protein [bacterium]
MLGKTIRLNRIFKRDKALVMALDYGLFSGVPENFVNLGAVLNRVNADLLDGIVITPGQLKNLPLQFHQTNLIVRVDACTVFGEFNATELITAVERAARMGADAILAFTLLHDKDSNLDFMKRMKLLNDASEAVGLPFIAEYLPTGTDVKQRDALRIIAEVGADIIKTNIPKSTEEMQDLKAVSDLPILLAGGSKVDDAEMLVIVESMMSAGADGVVFGRNAWNREDINGYLEKLSKVIYR